MTEEERRAADQYLLDVATRMQDGGRLVAVFDRLMKRGVSTLSDQDVVGTFAVAATVGRWKAFNDLGKRIIDKKRDLKPFHDAAMHSPTQPDFMQLHSMAEAEAKARGDTPMGELQWAAYVVKSLKLKIKEVEASDKDLARSIQNDFAKYPEGKETAVNEQRFIRTGAYAQMISTQPAALPMIGPATGTRFDLAGFADIPPSPSKQVEEYHMKLVKTDKQTKQTIWSGTYRTAVRRPLRLASSALPHIHF